jgi:hypothetical protein
MKLSRKTKPTTIALHIGNRSKMIIVNFCVLLMLLSFSTKVLAQQYSILKFNVAALASNKLSIAYERTISKKVSAQVMYQSGVFGHQGQTFTGGEYKVTGHGIVPEIRYYPFRGDKGLPAGSLFFGMDFRYLRFNEQYRDQNQNAIAYVNLGTLYNYGVEAGYKHSYKRLWVEMLFGYGFGTVTNDYKYNSTLIPNNYTQNFFLRNENKFLRFEFSIGFIVGRKVLLSKNGEFRAVSIKK